MDAFELIRTVEELAAEYLEMSENPSQIVIQVLANKVIKLQDYVQYLEKRVDQIHGVR